MERVPSYETCEERVGDDGELGMARWEGEDASQTGEGK